MSTPASEHRTGVRTTVPAVQVRGKCSFGARRRSRRRSREGTGGGAGRFEQEEDEDRVILSV